MRGQSYSRDRTPSKHIDNDVHVDGRGVLKCSWVPFQLLSFLNRTVEFRKVGKEENKQDLDKHKS